MSADAVDFGSEAGGRRDGRAWGLVIGLALALLPVLVRLQTPLDMLPYWDGDPTSHETILIGMTPAKSLIGDLVSVAGAAVLIACSDRRRVKAVVPVVLAGIGAWACLWHMPGKGYDARTLVSGGAWVSSAAVALGLWFAGQDRRVRLTAFALIVGAVGLLVMKGAYQCLIEHPTTVEAFQRNKAQIIADNGWSPDSAMAKAYERRLVQNEATGWFGFANVYATFAAMGVVVFALMTVGALRGMRALKAVGEETSIGPVVICGAGTALAGAALVMAGAKGGFAACLLGLAVGGALVWLRSEHGERWRRVAWLVGPLAIAAPLLAVVARGMVGERLGELSLLFRWFYMQGAWRIFGSHLAHGVGPDGFQAAYALAKNPLSPEDVTSPHCLPWDWMACLGLGGVAWVVWLVCMSAKAGPAAMSGAGSAGEAPAPPSPDPEADETRVLMRVVCVVAALSAMAAIPMQYAALLPEEALGVRIGGLVVWCVLSCGVLAASRRWSGGEWPVALTAGAVTVLAHTQIEITGALPQSCGAVLAVVVLAASGSGDGRRTEASSGPQARTGAAWAARMLGLIGCVGAAFMLLGPAHALWQGETRLAFAYRQLDKVRERRAALEAALRDHTPDAESIARRLGEIEPTLIARAAAMLPKEWPLARSASQLAMQLAQTVGRGAASPDARARSNAWAVRAVEYVTTHEDADLDGVLAAPIVSQEAAGAAFERLWVAAKAVEASDLDSLRSGWAATVCMAAADLDQPPSPMRDRWLDLAVHYLRRARRCDPYNPFHAQRLMDVLDTMGRSDEARVAARELLGVDALQRLDRTVRGLSERDRARAERIAGAGTPAQGSGVSPSPTPGRGGR